jgi:HK97 family phage portal protein
MGIKISWQKKGKSATGNSLGLDFIRNWVASDEVFPDNPQSLIDAYRNLVYSCSTKNAFVMSRQKIHLYMVSPKGTKNKTYPDHQLENSAYKKDVLDRSPGVIKAQILYSQDYEITEITEHPFLELFYNPNPFHAFTEFMMLSDLDMELAGNCYWLITKSLWGIPKTLDILPPQNTTPILGSDIYVKEYRYNSSMGQRVYDPSIIFHNRFPNPGNIAIGKSPLSACTNSVDLDNFALRYGKAIFKNMGVLAGYFHTKENLNETSFKKLKEELNKFKGYDNAGQTPLLDNGLEYNPTSISPQLLFESMITKKTDKDIARAFGVPISLIDVQDVNKANAETGSNTYEEHTIDPRNRLFSDKINQTIIPFYEQKSGIKIFCAFDNPAKEDNSLLLKKQVEFIKWGVYSVNEVRAEEGLAPCQNGEKRLIPVNYMYNEDYGKQFDLNRGGNEDASRNDDDPKNQQD